MFPSGSPRHPNSSWNHSSNLGSSIRITRQAADLTKFPSSFFKSKTLPDQDLFNSFSYNGDLHGRVVRRIYDLIKSGLITVAPEQYEALFSHDPNTCYRAFNTICENIELDSTWHSKAHTSLGDDLFDRCADTFDDGHTLKFDYVCIRKGLSRQFLMGNHDMQFYICLYKILTAKPDIPIAEKYGYENGMGVGQTASFQAFSQRLINHFSGKLVDPDLDNWLEWVIERLAHTALFSSELMFQSSGKPLLINGKHSRAGIKTFMLVANWLNSLAEQYQLPFIHYKEEDVLTNPSALPQLSSDVNQAFQALVLTENKKEIRIEGLGAFINSYREQTKIAMKAKRHSWFEENNIPCPLYSIMWETDYSDQDPLPEKIGDVSCYYPHGHIGPIKKKDAQSSEINLDSDLGKNFSILFEGRGDMIIPCFVTSSQIRKIPPNFTGICILYNPEPTPSHLEFYFANVVTNAINNKEHVIQPIPLSTDTDYGKLTSLLFPNGFFEGKTFLTRALLDEIFLNSDWQWAQKLIPNTTLINTHSMDNQSSNASLKPEQLYLSSTDTRIICVYLPIKKEFSAQHPNFQAFQTHFEEFQKCRASAITLSALHRIHEGRKLEEEAHRIFFSEIFHVNITYSQSKKKLFEWMLTHCLTQQGKKIFVASTDKTDSEETLYPSLSVTDYTYKYAVNLSDKIQKTIEKLPQNSMATELKGEINNYINWLEKETNNIGFNKTNFFHIKKQEAHLFHFLCEKNMELKHKPTGSSLRHFDKSAVILIRDCIENTIEIINAHLKAWNQQPLEFQPNLSPTRKRAL